MFASAANTTPFPQAPDDNLLETFLESSKWLSQHHQVLESLKTNYRESSPLFQNVLNDLRELNLSEYDKMPAKMDNLTVMEDISNGKKNEATLQETNAIGVAPVTDPIKSSKEMNEVKNLKYIYLRIISPKKMNTLSEVGPDSRRPHNPQKYIAEQNERESLKEVQKKPSFGFQKFKTPDLLLGSMSKPPETSISKVKVLTKVTDLSLREYKPIYSRPNLLSLKLFLPGSSSKKTAMTKGEEKINSLGRKSIFVAPSNKLTEERSPAENADVSRYDVGYQEGNCLKDSRTIRRRSVVGQNLPHYIQEQIKHNERPISTTTSNVFEEEESAKKNSETNGFAKSNFKDISNVESSQSSTLLSKGKTNDERINNLLENSQYLYHQNQRNRVDSDNGHNSISESGHIDSAISEGDKEYVLPCMFTRSLEDFDVNITYENLDDELQDEEVFTTLENGLENPTEFEDEQNIVNGYDSEDMRLYR